MLGQSKSFALLDAYLEAGGTFVDTVRVYSDWLPGAGQHGPLVAPER